MDMDTQHGHGLAAWTWKQCGLGHAAWTWKQYGLGHAAWTWICSMGTEM